MGKVDDRLKELGITLPEVPDPIANYVGAARAGDLVFMSGRGPREGGQFVSFGKLGQDLTVQQGYQAARLTMLNLISSLKNEIGDLDHVKRIVKVLGMVNSAPDFGEQPQVLNGASDLLVEIFGEKGRHARAAFGVVALPMNTSVEIEMIVEVE